jgi:hypothetical protein
VLLVRRHGVVPPFAVAAASAPATPAAPAAPPPGPPAGEEPPS